MLYIKQLLGLLFLDNFCICLHDLQLKVKGVEAYK